MSNMQSNINIIVSRYQRNTDWTEKFQRSYKDVSVLVYDKENPENPYNVPVNKGNEASTYLKYILDHYDTLPEWNYFIHDEEFAWHHRGSVVDLLQEALDSKLEYYNVNEYAYFDSDITDHERYEQLCEWWETYLEDYCPMKNLPRANWFYGYRGGAQFLIHKHRILQYPLDFYKRLYTWILESEYGRVPGFYFEWTWHVFWDIYPNMKKRL